MLATSVVGRMIASAQCAFCWCFFTFLHSLLLWDPPHLTHMNGLLLYDFVWPYCWHFINCMILLFVTRGCSVCMILFCNAFILYISLLFSARSESTKNKYSCSCTVITFPTLCPSSNSSCLISSVSVECCSYLMAIL